LKQGAAGIVYGRNIIAQPKPAKMTQALMAMLHKGTSAADALKIVNA
jgi:DhnA family fructose-bisphosphate aldolase class Ia